MSEPNVVSSKGQATTGIVDIDDDVQASFAGSGPTDTVQPQMEDVSYSSSSYVAAANYPSVVNRISSKRRRSAFQ
jgi:hypothetical protein